MRSTYAVPSRRRRKQLLDRAKGFYGNSSKNLRVAYDAVDKALVHSYEGRKQKKQQYRALWIVRINAACRALDGDGRPIRDVPVRRDGGCSVIDIGPEFRTVWYEIYDAAIRDFSRGSPNF